MYDYLHCLYLSLNALEVFIIINVLAKVLNTEPTSQPASLILCQTRWHTGFHHCLQKQEEHMIKHAQDVYHPSVITRKSAASTQELAPTITQPSKKKNGSNVAPILPSRKLNVLQHTI